MQHCDCDSGESDNESGKDKKDMRSGVEDDAACDTIYQLKEKIYECVSLIFPIFPIFPFFRFFLFVLSSPPLPSPAWPGLLITRHALTNFQKVTIISSQTASQEPARRAGGVLRSVLWQGQWQGPSPWGVVLHPVNPDKR